MNVGIVADSHDNLNMIRKAVAILRRRGAEVLIHAGDLVAPFAMKEWMKFKGRIIAIYGNNDGERKGLKKVFPGIKEGPVRATLAGKRISIVHALENLPARFAAGADVIVSGHSHVPEIRPGHPLIINPGECGGWLNGKPSIAILNLETMKAELIRIDRRQKKRRCR